MRNSCLGEKSLRVWSNYRERAPWWESVLTKADWLGSVVRAFWKNYNESENSGEERNVLQLAHPPLVNWPLREHMGIGLWTWGAGGTQETLASSLRGWCAHLTRSPGSLGLHEKYSANFNYPDVLMSPSLYLSFHADPFQIPANCCSCQ
jgi:hypothetical protein